MILTVDGVDVHYAMAGHGPPLVLLHGSTTVNQFDWQRQLPELHEFQRIMITFRGHGTSGTNGHDLRCERFIDDILAVLDHHGLRRVLVLAFSHGTMVATRLALVAPDVVKALGLVSFIPRVTPHLEQRMLTVFDSWPTWVDQLHTPRYAPGHWRELMRALLEDRRRSGSFLPEELDRVRCPVLLVQGDRDPFLPLSEAAYSIESWSAAKLFVVPGAGHAVQRQQPGLVNPVLVNFLAEHRERVAGGSGALGCHGA
ncbi:MAG: alpha/beta hydrolase [Actinomycetota bacterium]